MRTRSLSSIFLTLCASGVVSTFSLSEVSAQVSFTGLTTNTTIKPCDEFATATFQDPWDMNNNLDINNYFFGELGFVQSSGVSGGLFPFTTTLTGNGQIHLVTPALNNVQPVGGRFGQNYPINVAKYNQLAVRMNLSVWDESHGMKVQWDHGTLASDPNVRLPTVTSNITTFPGWRTYLVNLNTVGVTTNNGLWAAGGITGLSIFPTVTAQSGQIDYIRLEDSSSCGSATVAYSSSTVGTNDLYSLYLDSDNDPFNGYFTKYVSGAATGSSTSQAVTSAGLVPGSYKLVGVLDGDFFALELDNPKNFDDAFDVQAVGGVTNPAFTNGTYTGVTADASPNIFLVKPGGGKNIDASKYSKLSFKLTRSDEAQTFRLLWNGGGFKVLNQASPEHQGGGIYHVDLAAAGGWTGTITDFIIRPSDSAGNTFYLDWVRLRKSGYVSSETISATASTGNLVVSNPPTIKVLQPDNKGGEALRPWNFRPTDVLFSVNVDDATDPAFPAESKHAYLPDVRLVDGVRGDFFKGTNEAGDGDPNDYMTFPFFSTPSFTFDGTQYHNLCLKMTLNRDYDLALGSVSKFFFKRTDTDFIEEFDAFATIYDRWAGNRWYEYCMDLSTFPKEDGSIRYGGTIDAFRIDPHEFSFDSCCDEQNLPIGNPIQVTYYYDYLKLRKDDESRGKFALVYEVADADTGSPTVSWFYNTAKSTSGGTAIPGSALTCEGRVCIWDTTGVPAGNYYVYAQVTDGTNTNVNLSTGTVNVVNTGATGTQPTLFIEAPPANTTYCTSMQFKGYSLMTERFEDVAAVQVFIDGAYFTTIHPSSYSPKAVINHPNADSSNTGFDEFHAVSGLADGAHTIVYKAYSMDGGVTTSPTITFTKASGCADPAAVTDADPAGTPTGAVTNEDPTGGDTAPDADGPAISKLRHNRRGALSLSISNVGTAAESCQIRLFGGATENDVSTEIKSFDIKKREERKDVLQLRGNRVNISRSDVPTVFLQPRRTCGNTTSNGEITTFTVKTKKGRKDIASALNLIKKLKPQRKKRRSRRSRRSR